VLRAGLPVVFSPRQATLTARFFLDYDGATGSGQPLPIGGSGQTDFPLQVSQGDPTLYSLPQRLIPLGAFLDQIDTTTPNVLWVFVSDDFQDCPDPTKEVPGAQNPSSSVQTLACYTTSWSWVIDLAGCSLLSAQ